MSEAVGDTKTNRAFALSIPVLVLGIATGVILTIGFYMAMVYAPEEAVQGPAQRIFYLHLPAIWVGFLAFFVVFVASVGYLLTRRIGWDIVARSSAELGMIFLTLGIVTGIIWARPIWGIWYSFDPRGTSTLILWLTFVAYIMLRANTGSGPRTARFGSFLGILGFLNVPLVFMATRWWRTLHPEPTVITSDPEAGLPAEMLYAMLVGLLAFSFLYAFLMTYRVQLDRAKERILAMRAILGI